MITIISGSNKSGSLTRKVALNYFNRISETGQSVKLLDLEQVDFAFVSPSMYEKEKSEYIKNLQAEYFSPASVFVFVVPEYNGSFPGILKLLIDSLEVRSAFENKKAALVGVATGRAGNLRGLDHLAGILHHMHVMIIPGNVLISRAAEELDAGGNFVHDATRKLVDKQVLKVTTA